MNVSGREPAIRTLSTAPGRTFARAAVAAFAVLLVLTAGSVDAFAFGTIRTAGQNAEHERITRAALACAPNRASDGSCFEPASLNQVAGKRGSFGAVGAPDSDEILAPNAHCDSADFLAPRFIRTYPRTRAQASATFIACRNHLRGHFLAGVTAAGGVLDADGNVRTAEVNLASDCTFAAGRPGRAKCNAIERFGRLLHGAQDFYSHSNWSDERDQGRAIGVANPPGLARSGVAPLLDMRSAQNPEIPEDLLTGCFSLVPRGCKDRVTHDVLNKDLGTIDPATGRATAPTTDRGRVGRNFERAVAGAIAETRRQWKDFREAITRQYGEERGKRIICALTHDDPVKMCADELLLDMDATILEQRDVEPSSVRLRVTGLPLRRRADGAFTGEKTLEVVNYEVRPYECWTHTYDVKPETPFRVTKLTIDKAANGTTTVSMTIDPGSLKEIIHHACNQSGSPSEEHDERTTYNTGMANLVPEKVSGWDYQTPVGDAVFASRTVTGDPSSHFTGTIKFELRRPGLEGPYVCRAPQAFTPRADARLGQNAPPVPANGNGLEVTIDRNAGGQPVAATVKLNNQEGMYFPWTQNRECAAAAEMGRTARTNDRLYSRPGRQPSLRTYDRIGANGGAIDFDQTDLNWNAAKVAEIVGYIKDTIDANRPVLVGVNERGRRSPRRNGQGLQNDGVTDHFLLIHGYRLELVNGVWTVRTLYAVDNAAGNGAVGRYPTFDVANGAIRKPATSPNPGPAIEFEYQLTQVRVYQADLARVRLMTAWWDP